MTPIAPRERDEALARVSAALDAAARDLVPGGEPPAIALEAPRNPGHGDFSSSVALQLAKRARRAPQQLASDIVARVAADASLREIVSDITALGGFINVRMSAAYWQRAVGEILQSRNDYGRGASTGERISLEFGSANPTGPLVVVQGRTLSLGDSIAKAMRFCGIDVTTEWIINDAGSQVDTLGRSLYARYRQLADSAFPFPQGGGYPGAYLLPIAREVREREGERFDGAPESEWLPYFAKAGRDALVDGQRRTAERFGVYFDRWQSEKELHDSGAVGAGIAALRARGLTYEKDGATYLRTTQFGDDKDRVLVRSDGRPTYYAPDVAYHYDKLQRADRAILILGPDHHGYVARLGTIAAAFGKPGAIEVLIAQQMTTVRDGEIVSLSKRHGDVLTLDEVIDEVGVDAARFFFVMMNADSPMTFDLTLAKEQTKENPVFYVQYAHARIASVVRRADGALLTAARRGEGLQRLIEPAEIALARRLVEFPGAVRAVALRRAPSQLARYAQTVAGDFTQFYDSCRVLTADAELSAGRLGLALAAKSVLASALGLLGVGAPEAMERLEPEP